MKYLDLKGRPVQVGDIVVVPQTHSTSAAWLCLGEVTMIEHLPKSVKVHIKVFLDGENAYQKDGSMKPGEYGNIRVTYTEGSLQHSKLLILNRNEI